MSSWGSTRLVPAEAALAEGVVLAGTLHLMARVAFPPGPETPLELLNRAEPFFALTLDGGGVALVAKAQLAVLTCRDVPPPDPARLSAAKLVDLEVTVVGGAEYRGRAAVELPRSRSRALDFLNDPDPFFPLCSDDAARYLNKRLVRLIRPLD